MGREDVYLAETITEIKHLVLALVTLNKKLKNRVSELELQHKLFAEEKERLEMQFNELQENYNILKLAKAVQGNEDDKEDAKNQISKLMREINQCMLLVQNL